MGLFAWFTCNWADTDEPGDGTLAPVELPLPALDVLARLRAVIDRLTRWRVESVDTAAGVLRATRRTRLWRFIDDVTICLEPIAAGTRVHARSQSRVGKGDLGQNRRNLHELFQALQQSDPS